MDRRHFLALGMAAGAAAATGIANGQETTEAKAVATPPPGAKFRLRYAPHLGSFEELAGKDPIDQIKFMADQGFRAFEDNGMLGRPRELQDKIGAELQRLGMTMGVFTAHADFGNQTFVKRDPEIRKMLVEKMKAAVELANRLNSKWFTVVPDQFDPKADRGYQTANVIDNLRACVEVCEPAGKVMVIEPLNKINHPSLFLTASGDAYAICRAVNSPSCKILFDVYHQQITEGNLIPNIDNAWSEIGYFHLGDNPGRKEPSSGEINFRNIFKHLHEKGYDGVLGMEHGKSKKGREGELAVIAAYREADSF